jgi:hypothetical protein
MMEARLARWLYIDRLITWTWTATGGTGMSHGTFKGNIVVAKDE